MIILGIETSCDETAASICKDGKILSNFIYSQVKTHAKFGGVVPEIASREHIKKIAVVVQNALKQAHLDLKKIDAIAVTHGPGLIGSLVVGVSFAKSLSYSLNIPLITINHIEGHLLSAMIDSNLNFPFIGLVVSGGHTSIFKCTGLSKYKLLGLTIDDAAGEAYDKAAKLLGLPYPGGALIDKLAKNGNKKKYNFPIALKEKDNLNFSFSGLKTQIAYFVKEHKPSKKDIPNIAASFQEAVVDALTRKTLFAIKQTRMNKLAVAGGVARNSRLREKMEELAKENGIKCYFPKAEYCTDNAAMIAFAGWKHLSTRYGVRSTGYDFDAISNLKLTQ